MDDLSRPPFPSEPKMGLQPVENANVSPTGVALLGQNIVRVASVIGGLAVLVGGIFALFLPQPWAVTGAAICASVVLLATKIEAMGPGIRKAAPESKVETPRIGPPA